MTNWRERSKCAASKTLIPLVMDWLWSKYHCMKFLFLTLLLTHAVLGVTREVVQVFQPLSFHFTDTAAEFGPQGDLVQANVVSRPLVLSGAFPEDLAKAVMMPCRLDSNNPTYQIPEVNLARLAGLTLEVIREEQDLEVIIDCSEASLPEEIELGLEVVLKMTVECIRRTLRVYYQDNGPPVFECKVTILGLRKGQERWADYGSKFQVSSGVIEKNPATDGEPALETGREIEVEDGAAGGKP